MRGWFLVWVVGCGGGGSSDVGYPPPDPLDAAYTQCDVPEDCVALELGCCDACNGGLAVGVRDDQADEVFDRYSEHCKQNQACTEMGCADWVVDCAGGTCTIERGSF